MNEIMVADTHIHLSHHQFGNNTGHSEPVPCIAAVTGEEVIRRYTRDELIKALKEAGVEFCVEPGISAESNAGVLELAEAYKGFLFPAVGVHPTRTGKAPLGFYRELEKMAANPMVAAIGELGLDYHHPRKTQRRLRQKWWFIKQIKLADKLKLPLILHLRAADKDSVRILRKYKKKIHGGVCHCFNGGPELAKIYTDEMGLMLGIGGSILQESCSELEEAVRNTDIKYIVLETDGPYVKPSKPDSVSAKQWNKARNTSFIITDVARRVASLKGMDYSDVARITTENAHRLFKIS